MNAWDMDPNLHASFWKLLHEWFMQRVRRKSDARARADIGCRA